MSKRAGRNAGATRISLKLVVCIATMLLVAGVLSLCQVVVFDLDPGAGRIPEWVRLSKLWATDKSMQLLGTVTPPDSGEAIVSFGFVCLTALLIGAAAYAAIRVFGSLAGYDLGEVLKGRAMNLIIWCYVFALGVVLGALAALLTGLTLMLAVPGLCS